MIPPRPMLASTGSAPLHDSTFAYEPKYDGIRTIATVDGPRVQLWSRLGNDKSGQFPEIVDALAAWGGDRGRRVILDGEIVALDARGLPAGFQNLQGRIHLGRGHEMGNQRQKAEGGIQKTEDRRQKTGAGSGTPAAAFIVFDVLRDGDTDLCGVALHDRRLRLESLLRGIQDPRLRISEQVVGDGRALHARAIEEQWEGIIAKRRDSLYRAGRRSPDWCKLKLVRHQTCVVGGWTEPRGSRPFFGALLLGVYTDDGPLQYIGHTGAGFSDAELGRIWKRLQAIQTRACPFTPVPRTNERPHWVKPILVAEVKFTEWTADSKLRHPTYLGMRDDVDPGGIRKEPGAPMQALPRTRRRTASALPLPEQRHRGAAATTVAPHLAADRSPRRQTLQPVLDQLDELESRGGNGVIELPDGRRLEVSNLGKVFWPARTKKERPLTKGDLFRHYVRAAPAILPALADRPLVMKRYPNGIGGKPFYQHRASTGVPPGVRVDEVSTDNERRPHLVGGDLVTLLYTAQLASISQDPWFSRVGSEGIVDHVAIDLDPPDGLPFARVLDVARWVHDELQRLKAPAFPKTSGSGGLHIYVPMPPGTPYDAGLLYCQIVATVVARKHPKLATVERSISARGGRIYVDYLQNIQGKTLASAYSARANAFAGVSTPLTWDEVEHGVEPQDFTIRNFAERLAAVGDLWAALRKAKGADLRAVTADDTPTKAKHGAATSASKSRSATKGTRVRARGKAAE